jgi:hypothetical protein
MMPISSHINFRVGSELRAWLTEWRDAHDVDSGAREAIIRYQ